MKGFVLPRAPGHTAPQYSIEAMARALRELTPVNQPVILEVEERRSHEDTHQHR